MKMIVGFLFAVFLCLNTEAAVQGLNKGASLGNMTQINCDMGLRCTKAGGSRMNIVAGNTVNVATATTLVKAQCGQTFINSAAVEVDLPEASTVVGCRFTFCTANASNFDIDPEAADQIIALTNAVGDRARNATVGNCLSLQAINAVNWAITGQTGTWTDAD
jgi:hypothetical protein